MKNYIRLNPKIVQKALRFFFDQNGLLAQRDLLRSSDQQKIDDFLNVFCDRFRQAVYCIQREREKSKKKTQNNDPDDPEDDTHEQEDFVEIDLTKNEVIQTKLDLMFQTEHFAVCVLPDGLKKMSSILVLNNVVAKHVFFLTNSATKQALLRLKEKKTIETFSIEECLCSAYKHVYNKDLQLHVVNPKNFHENVRSPSILTNDPLIKFYNFKSGSLLALNRVTTNGSTTEYKKVKSS